MGLIFKDGGEKPFDPEVARKRAILLSLPFAGIGFLALVLLLHDGLMGGVDRQKLFKLLGVIAASIGFVALIFGVNAKKTTLAAQLRESLAADSVKPWLRRADWAAGRIKSAGIPHAKSYLTMGLALCVLGGLIAGLMVPKALRERSYSGLGALLFPIVGIVFLVSVIRKFLAHGQFGDCVLEMAQTPATIGGALDGAIRTTRPLKWQGELRLELLCVRKTTTGTGQNRRTDEKNLWQDGTSFKPQADPAGVLPVHFDLPPGRPECSKQGNEEICWRLELKIPAANFHATFDVPVFEPVRDDPVPKAD